MLVYGGLLGLTYWQFTRTPTGFIPQQDKGYLVLNVQLPDSASVRADAADHGPHRGPGHSRLPGVAHTVGISGQSLILGANAPNLGSMYVMLDEFRRPPHDRTSPPTPSPRRWSTAAAARRRGAIVTAFGPPPIDGLGTTGGFKLIVEDRGNLGLDEPATRQRQDRRRGQRHAGAAAACSTAPASTRPGCTSTSTAPSAWPWACSVSDVFNTLQIYLGSFYVNNFNEFGRTWQVNVQADQRFRDQVADIRAAPGPQQPGTDDPPGHADGRPRHQRSRVR